MASGTYYGKVVIYISGVTSSNVNDLNNAIEQLKTGWKFTGGKFIKRFGGVNYDTSLTTSTTITYSSYTYTSGMLGLIFYAKASITNNATVYLQNVQLSAVSTASKSLLCNGVVTNMTNPASGITCVSATTGSVCWSAYTHGVFNYEINNALYDSESEVTSNYGATVTINRANSTTKTIAINTGTSSFSALAPTYTGCYVSALSGTESYSGLANCAFYAPNAPIATKWNQINSATTEAKIIYRYPMTFYVYDVGTQIAAPAKVGVEQTFAGGVYNVNIQTGGTRFVLSGYSAGRTTNSADYYTAKTRTLYVSGSTNAQFYYGGAPYFYGEKPIDSTGYFDTTATPDGNTVILHKPYYYNFAFYRDGEPYTKYTRIALSRAVGTVEGNPYPARLMDDLEGKSYACFPVLSSSTINYSAYTPCGIMVGGTLSASTQPITSAPTF